MKTLLCTLLGLFASALSAWLLAALRRRPPILDESAGAAADSIGPIRPISPIKTVCMDCGCHLKGDATAHRVSHGLCVPCFVERKRELEAWK